MKRKTVFITCFILFFILNGRVVADELNIAADTEVLVIFSSEDGEMDEHQRLLDMAVGHFSNETTFKNVDDVTSEDLENISHLFYYGQIQAEIPEETVSLIEAFDGPTVAIGNNIEQLEESFSFVETDGETSVDELKYSGDDTKTREVSPQLYIESEIIGEADTIVEGSYNGEDYPLIMNLDQNYYVAVENLYEPFSVYFSQVLNTVFDVEPSDTTPAYLRLEDVHPLADPDLLMEIADELKEREIPYMITVIPVYLNSETGEQIGLAEKPEVLNALRYMQDNGGSIVLHGYTHQFRLDETGEGFEFWDVENNMPIYHGPEDDVVQLTEDDFDSSEEYESYMEENKAFEREYIEDRLTRGVQELANMGLYPLAFEPPHYTMSQNGLEITSEMFSTYVGQLQLTDEDWEIMNTTPYVTQPDFLNDMVVLPETIGFVVPDSEAPVDEMMEKADLYQVLDGGMLGGFYHPYLGVDRMIELIESVESIPDVEWLDLKEMDNRVEVDYVTIQSEDGEVAADINSFRLMTESTVYPAYHARTFAERAAWVIAWIGGISVVVLLFFTAVQKIKSSRLLRRRK